MNEMGLELEDRHMLTSNVAGIESGKAKPEAAEKKCRMN